MYITPTWGMSCMGKPRPSRWTRIASGNLHACGFLCCPWSCTIVCLFPGDIFVRSQIMFGQSRHVQFPVRVAAEVQPPQILQSRWWREAASLLRSLVAGNIS